MKISPEINNRGHKKFFCWRALFITLKMPWFVTLIKTCKRNLAIYLYRWNLLPSRYKPMVEAYLSTRCFGNPKLIWDNRGYWNIELMPSQEQLEDYWSKSYWQERGGKDRLLNKRDLEHFIFLKNFLGETGKKYRVLNFGAGHGGVSFLFSAMGCDVVNIEPSDMDLELGQYYIRDIRDVTGSFDLIYSSQTLNYITVEIYEFIGRLTKILNPGGLLFFEVPNCHCQNSKSYPDGQAHVPHTYYFTREFFKTLDYFDILLNKTFLINKKGFYSEVLGDDGDAIRFLGKKK